MTFRLIFTVLMAMEISVAGPAARVSEYEVKAGFLLNFARYVEWPPEVFPLPDEPLLICVLGQDPFGRALDDVMAGKSVEGREVAVRRVADTRDAQGCRILFTGAGERKANGTASALPDALPEYGVLTVGEGSGRGGENMVINFVMEHGKTRFTVNLRVAARQKLRLSSRLLGLASSVKK